MSEAAKLDREQKDYWNGPGGDRWVANQRRRDLLLVPFGAAALAKAAPRPGEYAIDIGCGCGETTEELARAVGPAGQAIGVDVSAPILEVARQRLAELPQASVLLADAGRRGFEPGAADLLFSRFGVMFFGDPAAAFANLRRALKPDGRLVFACWRSPAENGWMTGPLEAVWKHVEKPPPPDPHAPGPFAFADADRVGRILTEAGFTAPSFERFDVELDVGVGEGVPGAVQTALQFGAPARALADQPDPVRTAVEASLHDYYAAREQQGRVMAPAAVWLATARA